MTIHSVSDLLSASLMHATGAAIWYRGHSRDNWNLQPSLARYPKGLEAEMALIKRFQQDAVHFVEEIPATSWDWLFLMQHHGVPTRLLDWTEGPLVGLYFAVNEHMDADGILWCLDPVALNVLSGLSRGHAMELPCFGVDDVLDIYLPERLAKDPVGVSSRPAAAISRRRFLRLYAQLGVFTVTHREITPLDHLGTGDHVWRYRIPAADKGKIQSELTALGVTRVKLFPELQHLADVIKGEILQ